MLLAPRLVPGDRVLLVSSAPTAEHAVETLSGWGLTVQVIQPAADDRRQVADLNAALRDSGIRAIVIADADIGAYRIADLVDADAARRDPKPIVGIDDITHLHLALWRQCRLAGIHGTLAHKCTASETLRSALMGAEPVCLRRHPGDITATVSAGGRAAGVLIGGSLSAVRGGVGVGLPSLDGAILLLGDKRTIGLGQVDRQLTQLLRSGSLDGVRGVAVGRFTGFDGYVDREWTLVDVLQERLSKLGVPVLGGLQVGHGPESLALPIGPAAVLDADAGTLVIDPAVR
jgi:muramoyltetrapeptide carboxypeptidase